MARKNWKEKEKLEELSRCSIQYADTSNLLRAKKFISSLLNYKKLDKLDTTFVQGPKKAITYNGEPVVHCDFNLDGTVTGRLSCSTYYGNDGNPMGVSFHTLPNKSKDLDINIRDIYAVKAPWSFITADYSTMELRVLAELADVREMKHAFSNHLDLHTHTASLIFKKSIEDILPHERQLAKTANFLIIYGGGAPNLAEVVGVSIHEAQRVIDRHKIVYPEVHKLMAETEAKLREFKYVENPFGRVRNLPDIDSPEFGVQLRAIRQAFNMLIQSTASDILLCANMSLINSLGREFYSICGDDAEHVSLFRIVANVHDSMEVIVNSSLVNEAVGLIKTAMIENPVMRKLVNFTVPFEVDIEVGTSFGNGESVDFDLLESLNEDTSEDP